jgi:hypothetical protein
MVLTFTKHEKVSLRQHTEFNEAWLHDRICEDPSLLGLGDDIRVVDRERPISGAGRLDILLFDEDNNRRYEVEIMLGATDPSHIIRTIEYWDVERRRYPGYDHVAVLVAENITTRFLNVMSLLAGSIPIIAIQLDALRVGDSLVLNFVQVLDQAELRVDDTDDGGGGPPVDRAYWNQKAGPSLMKVCDEVLAMINKVATLPQELNYLRGYIGLCSNGVVRNFIHFAPKPTKRYTHVDFRNSNAEKWKERFEEAGIQVTGKWKGRFRISVTAEEFAEHKELLQEVIEESVREYEE